MANVDGNDDGNDDGNNEDGNDDDGMAVAHLPVIFFICPFEISSSSFGI